MDTVSPLSRMKHRGKIVQHVLTILESYTHYLTVVPIKENTAETIVCALLESYVYVHGMPESFHSDRGMAFTSRLFTRVLKALNIRQTTTRAYDPESN